MTIRHHKYYIKLIITKYSSLQLLTSLQCPQTWSRDRSMNGVCSLQQLYSFRTWFRDMMKAANSDTRDIYLCTSPNNFVMKNVVLMKEALNVTSLKRGKTIDLRLYWTSSGYHSALRNRYIIINFETQELFIHAVLRWLWNK